MRGTARERGGHSVEECRLARPGSVDVLGRTVGAPAGSLRIALAEDEGAMAGHGAVPCGSLFGTP